MSQAIETYVLPATNTRGTRIKAKAWGGSVTIAYPYGCDHTEAHRLAAFALVEKMGWPISNWHCGGNSRGDGGYYFVQGEGA